MELTHSSVTVQAIPSKPGKQFINPNDVVFDVKYPEGYTGQRLMPEGPVVISKESADLFTARGLGKVVEAGEQPAGEESPAEVKAEDTPTEVTKIQLPANSQLVKTRKRRKLSKKQNLIIQNHS